MGDFGAYGAGLLNGWSASGQRPRFKIVTGISTGSLIAPYAFLGPDWDEALKSAYLGITNDDDVINSRSFIAMLTSDSLTSTEPLQKLIAHFVEAQFFVPLRAIDLPAAIKEAKANGFPATPVPRMFVIGNSKFHPEPKQVERGLGPIVERTISTMTQAMGRSDLYQIFAIANARGGDFQYAEIPADFIWNSDQEFDGPEMKRLYDIGYGRGADGTAWTRTPPGFFSVNTAPNE